MKDVIYVYVYYVGIHVERNVFEIEQFLFDGELIEDHKLNFRSNKIGFFFFFNIILTRMKEID